MPDRITLLAPDAPADSRAGSLASLPPDLQEQVRGRVRLLALFLTIGFAIDPVLYFANYGVALLVGVRLPAEFYHRLPFQWGNLGGAAASALLWTVTRRRSVTPARLLTLGLLYEVGICFVIAFGTIWEYYVVTDRVPLMTWVNAVVIMFPVLLPGPPRRMLVAAAGAAAMTPLALIALSRMGVVRATLDDYSDAVIQGAFCVALAYMGARVVYGLGREVARARELGSYRLVGKLGEGGMGEVWRAEHRMLARPAAIKLIRGGGGQANGVGVSTEACRRFKEPGDRPQTAMELLQRLDDVPVPSPWTEDRAREWWRRQGLPDAS